MILKPYVLIRSNRNRPADNILFRFNHLNITDPYLYLMVYKLMHDNGHIQPIDNYLYYQYHMYELRGKGISPAKREIN